MQRIFFLLSILVLFGCGISVNKPPGLHAAGPTIGGCQVLTGEYLTRGTIFADWNDPEPRLCDLNDRELVGEEPLEVGTLRCRCTSSIIQEDCSKLTIVSKTAFGREISQVTRDIEVAADGAIVLSNWSARAHSDGLSAGVKNFSDSAYKSKEGWLLIKRRRVESGLVMIPPLPYWSGDETWFQIPPGKDREELKHLCKNN